VAVSRALGARRTVDIPAGTIDYRERGEGTPVVFVHSWALSSVMWQYQMMALVDRGVRCVAHDRRGHGRSDQPGRGYDYDSLADDLSLVLETLDLRDVTLVGHSMGTGEIIRYLTRHGDGRVDRIVLVSPIGPFPLQTHDNPHGFPQAVVEAVRQSWKEDFPAWVVANADDYVGNGLPGCRVSSGLVEWTIRDMLRTSLLAVVECNRTCVETDQRFEFSTISVPTLIIQGNCDASIPIELSGRVAAQLIRGSRLCTYENGPHGLYLTHRDRLTHDLQAFVEA
jgi:pimeloyl-ACP methyl ester carboxylesterase